GPDGRHCAFVCLPLRMVKVLDVTTGQSVFNLKGPPGFFKGVTFSPDGRWLASGGESPRVWDLTTGQEVPRFADLSGEGCTATFSPDSQRFAWNPGHEVQVLDTPTGRVALTLKGHADRILDLTYSPDGARLASASFDRTIII